MMYFLIPLIAAAAIGLVCVDVKIGLIVSEMTEGTGFSAGFYMMTVIGLLAAEVSAALYLADRFVS